MCTTNLIILFFLFLVLFSVYGKVLQGALPSRLSKVGMSWPKAWPIIWSGKLCRDELGPLWPSPGYQGWKYSWPPKVHSWHSTSSCEALLREEPSSYWEWRNQQKSSHKHFIQTCGREAMRGMEWTGIEVIASQYLSQSGLVNKGAWGTWS